MFLNISSDQFKNVFKQKDFSLPKRWSGKDFRSSVESLLKSYQRELQKIVDVMPYDKNYEELAGICDGIVKSIESYFNGYPSEAFNQFSDVMETLMKNPLRIYLKTGDIGFSGSDGDPLKLYRVRNVHQNTTYSRSDIFHTPYNLRSKVATCRYSIVGYPSLYLGTSLELCGEESKVGALNEFQIASRFELVRDSCQNDTSIKVIELAIKPQDFFSYEKGRNVSNNIGVGRYFDELNLNNNTVRSAYISWYPLIAACSFIRISKSDPFAAEYIIPQLLMQWIRYKFEKEGLFGIRYFSCVSIRASDMGFNYVFPVSGKGHKDKSQFCEVLAKSFKMTVPKFIQEYQSWKDCEKALQDDANIGYIWS